jgi:hypothetical protein
MLDFCAMRFLPAVLALLLTYVALAQDIPKTMTKLTVQLDGPGIPKDSFVRKPKTIYRATNQYCRVEEAVDTEQHIQALLILNEPDAWMLNLLDKTGRHVVDPGPTFNCHLPVFSGPLPDSDDDVDYSKLGLEFGRELEFFKGKNARVQKGQVLQHQETTMYFIELGKTRLALFVYGPNDFPLALGRTCNEKGEIFWYSSYGQVSFDPKLFAKPEGVSISEVGQKQQ